jgi:hypothetical protein
MTLIFELIFDTGDPLVDGGDRLDPGFEDAGGVACVEGAGMRLSGGVFSLGLFEPFFEVGESLFEVFFAHRLRVHCASFVRSVSDDSNLR